MIKPSEIKATEFDMSVLGGYKRESVDSFFDSLYRDYEKLYTENTELAQKLKVCIEKIEEYQKDEKFLKAAIINAEKLNETALRDIETREKEIEQLAKDRAENIVEKAKIEAENIVKTARIKADEAIKACEKETAEKISALNAQVDSETDKLNAIKKEVADFKESVLKLYKDHLNSLSKLPDHAAPETKAEPVQQVQPVEKIEKVVEEPVAEKVETAPVTELKGEVIEDKVELDAIHFEMPKENAVPVKPVSEKTAEFVIEKKTVVKDENDFDKSFKFQGLKFGADFDIKNDK